MAWSSSFGSDVSILREEMYAVGEEVRMIASPARKVDKNPLE